MLGWVEGVPVARGREVTAVQPCGRRCICARGVLLTVLQCPFPGPSAVFKLTVQKYTLFLENFK